MAVERIDIAALEAACFEWTSPGALIERADQLNLALGDAAMLRPGRTYREAFVAARFAVLREVDQVRLLREGATGTTPDFEIRRVGDTLRYETTEADWPGRRRQDEYRQDAAAADSDLPLVDAAAMLARVTAVAIKKAGKAYEACQGLVIWLNPPVFAIEPPISWTDLQEACAPAAGRFTEVWLMRERGALLWRDGELVAPLPISLNRPT